MKPLQKSFSILLAVCMLLCAAACANHGEPPPGTGIVEGFENATASSEITDLQSETQTTSAPATTGTGSEKTSSKTATSAATSSGDTAKLKSLCNEYAKHNLLYTVAQYSTYTKLKYSFLPSDQVLSNYFAIDTSKKDLHIVTTANGQVNETYYSQGKKVLFSRLNEQLVQAGEDVFNQFDFNTEMAKLAPKVIKLYPEDIAGYNLDGEKITFVIKNTQKFTDFYEDIGADPSNTVRITFYGKDMDELYETITIKGSFTVGGQKKQGTATIEQESHRLWNVPAPSWLKNN